MTEPNPGDRELHLEYSDPFQSATERLGSEAGMRRLFLVNFSCPLKGSLQLKTSSSKLVCSYPQRPRPSCISEI